MFKISNPDPAERIATSVLHSVKSILCSTLCQLSTQVRAAHPQVDALTRWVVSDDWIDKYISKSVCYSPDWHAPTHTLQGEDSSAQPTARKTDNLQLVFSSNAPCAHLHSQTHRNTHADISAITCQSALPLSYKHRLFFWGAEGCMQSLKLGKFLQENIPWKQQKVSLSLAIWDGNGCKISDCSPICPMEFLKGQFSDLVLPSVLRPQASNKLIHTCH